MSQIILRSYFHQLIVVIVIVVVVAVVTQYFLLMFTKRICSICVLQHFRLLVEQKCKLMVSVAV